MKNYIVMIVKEKIIADSIVYNSTIVIYLITCSQIVEQSTYYQYCLTCLSI